MRLHPECLRCHEQEPASCLFQGAFDCGRNGAATPIAQHANGVVMLVPKVSALRGTTNSDAAPDEERTMPADNPVVGDITPPVVRLVEQLSRLDARGTSLVALLAVAYIARVMYG